MHTYHAEKYCFTFNCYTSLNRDLVGWTNYVTSQQYFMLIKLVVSIVFTWVNNLRAKVSPNEESRNEVV